MMLKVFVSGPITKGNLGDNVNQAAAASMVLLKAGLSPFCPHLSVFFDGITSRDEMRLRYWGQAHHLPGGTKVEDWYSMDEPWVRASDVLLRLPGESVGADLEVGWAREEGIPVFHTVEDVVAWAERPATLEEDEE